MLDHKDLALKLEVSLPDIPRWVETKWMLRNLQCEILALEETPELRFIVLDRRTWSVEIVGRPEADAIAQAAAAAGERAEVVAPIESADHVANALPAHAPQPAVLHVLVGDDRVAAPDGAVRSLSSNEVAALDVPEELHQELLLATETTRIIAATIVNGKPVSFCYPGSETETLWDVSIDTLEPYRRQGHATSCVRYVIDLMRARGKEPIWGALEDNIPSMRLAAKLGFVPVDWIVLFEHL